MDDREEIWKTVGQDFATASLQRRGPDSRHDGQEPGDRPKASRRFYYLDIMEGPGVP
jgi:hypothetical protein